MSTLPTERPMPDQQVAMGGRELGGEHDWDGLPNIQTSRTRAGILRPTTLARLATLGNQKMDRFRRSRVQLLKRYVGRLYGRMDDFRAPAYPVNMIYQAAATLVPNLVYQDPRVRITSQFLDYKFYADVAELALDYLAGRINLRGTLRRVVTDSIFLAGFMKVGLGTSGQTLDAGTFTAEIGAPYAERVDPDDMILDPTARVWEEQRLIGNRFRVDADSMQAMGLYDPDVIGRYASRYQEHAAIQNSASGLSGIAQVSEADELLRMLDLIELWIPEEQLIVTMPWSPGGEVIPEIVQTAEHAGPDTGPYFMLGYGFAPDNILPVAPANTWYDLDEMVNRVIRKVTRQADRQKMILAYESAGWEDAQSVVDADDGEAVRVDNIEAIREINLGGARDEGYRYIEWGKTQFSEMAMNIDLLSGTRTDEPTATQAQMLQANTTIRLADMQHTVYQLVQGVERSLFFYLHTDPLIELPLTRSVRGEEQQVVYTPEMRRGDWLDYNIRIIPFSMARQDPNTRIRRLMEFAGSVIPAAAQAFQMLGPVFNMESFMALMLREMGIEEGENILNSQLLAMMSDRMRQMLEMGVPVDPKVYQTMMGTQGRQGGGRPGEPNPMAMLPMGVTPQREQHMMQQDAAAEIQRQGGF